MPLHTFFFFDTNRCSATSFKILIEKKKFKPNNNLSTLQKPHTSTHNNHNYYNCTVRFISSLTFLLCLFHSLFFSFFFFKKIISIIITYTKGFIYFIFSKNFKFAQKHIIKQSLGTYYVPYTYGRCEHAEHMLAYTYFFDLT